jgi:hypothetical protein
MYHVYELIDPITNLPFYIGKGTGFTLTRLDDHLLEAIKPSEEQVNQLKCNMINSILKKGYTITHNITLFDSEPDAFEYEKTLISKYGRIIDNSGILTNICPGGRGGWHNFGKVVYQFDLMGNLIKEYKSMVSAANDINVTASAIWACLSPTKQSTQCGGYMWSRTPQISPKCILAFRNRQNQSSSIYKINISGQIVNRFDNIQEAAKEIHVNWSSIGTILNSHNKTCKGYFWANNIQDHYITILQYTNELEQIEYTYNANVASIKLNISPSAIGRQIKGDLKMIKGYKFTYVNLTLWGNEVGT